MPVRDVTPAVRSVQTAIHQRLTPEARLIAAMEMSDFARSLAEAGIRSRNPDLSDAEFRRLVIETLYGRNGRR
ncbi:MAG TPA: hypothetical protein VN181_01430 [Thermoanaerobaculia bacterium]|nr:hypothetical protein [Thermoanaerobaculia bacterium]